MAEQRDRGLFHHNKKKDEPVLVETTEVKHSTSVVDGKTHETTEVKKHAHLEHMAEAGAVLGGVMAKYEKHQAKKHPEEAHKHHVGEAIAGAVAAGSGLYAAHQHHDKKEAKKESKHHLF